MLIEFSSGSATKTAHLVRRCCRQVLCGDGRQVGRQVPRRRRRILLLLVQEGDLLEGLSLLPLLKHRDTAAEVSRRGKFKFAFRRLTFSAASSFARSSLSFSAFSSSMMESMFILAAEDDDEDDVGGGACGAGADADIRSLAATLVASLSRCSSRLKLQAEFSAQRSCEIVRDFGNNPGRENLDPIHSTNLVASQVVYYYGKLSR